MNYQVLFEGGPTGYSALVPDLPGVYAAGETLDKTRELIAGAIDMHIRALVADGEPVPEPTHFELHEVAVPV